VSLDDFYGKENQSEDEIAFKKKSDFLESKFARVDRYSVLCDIFKNDEVSCKILVGDEFNKKLRSVKIKKLDEIASKNQSVSFYPYTFDGKVNNELGSVRYEALREIFAIIIDLDHVSVDGVKGLAKRIETLELKPNYIVNSGNGIHLHYVLKNAYDIKAATAIRLFFKDGCPKCDDKRYMTFMITKDNRYIESLKDNKIIYRKLSENFKDINGIEIDSNIHLAQPFRLIESKSKIGTITEAFKVSDRKYDYDEIAEALGIPIAIPSIDDIADYLHLLDEPLNKEYKEEQSLKRKKKYSKTKEKCSSTKKVSVGKRNEISSSKNAKKFNVNIDIIEADFKAFEELSIKQRESGKAKNKPSAIQFKGLRSQYNQALNQFRTEGRIGNRKYCLFCFWQVSSRWVLDDEEVKKDFYSLVEHYNSLSPSNKVTQKEIDYSLTKPRVAIHDDKIEELTGIRLKFVNKRRIEREKSKKETAENRSRQVAHIIKLSKDFHSENPKGTWDQLHSYINASSVSVSQRTLKSLDGVIEVRNKYKEKK